MTGPGPARFRGVALAAAGRGHQVYKFSPEGTLLLTLGTGGTPGGGPDRFNCPADVVTAPDGSIYAEPIAADNRGNVFVGEVHPHTLRKFRRKD